MQLKKRKTRLKRRRRSLSEFGYPCGQTFIPERNKCYTDPKTGKKLKVPITYTTYKKIVGSKGKAAQSLYRDREQAIRDRRRAAVPGWKKQKPLRPSALGVKITPQDRQILEKAQLSGSQKQIEWANTLREKSLIDIKKELILYAKIATKNNPDGESISQKDFEALEKNLVNHIASDTDNGKYQDAKFWIDRRFQVDQQDITRPVMREYIANLVDSNDSRIPESTKQSVAKYKQKQQAKRQNQENYKSLTFPEIEGTEKQIKYAESIRDKLINKANGLGLDAKKIQEVVNSDEKYKSAKWWIESATVSSIEEDLKRQKLSKQQKRSNLSVCLKSRAEFQSQLKKRKIYANRY